MLVVLQTISDGKPGRRVQLRSDQALRVGRSGWADFSIENDAALGDEHFEVRCATQGCLVRPLAGDAETRVNDEPITTATLVYDGDEIAAGASRFRLNIEGGPARQAPAEPEPDPEPETTVADAAPSGAAAAAAAAGLVGVCAYLEFGADVGEMAQSTEQPDELIEELANQEKYQDALRLRAYLLEKRQAVWWGCGCLREELGSPLAADQADAVDASAAWVADPDESNRRQAEAKAEAANFSGPGATLALAAFWSGGSLAPAGAPDVEADERLTSQGVAAALITAAYAGDPTQATDYLQAFLARGRQVADGTIPLPEAN